MSAVPPSSKKSKKRTIKPKWLLRFLNDEGMDRKAIAKVVGLDAEHFLDDQGWMPLDSYLQLFEWAAREFDRPHLGLELAINSEVDDFGVIGFLAISADTFGEGFRNFERYQRILMQGEVMQFIEHDDCVELRFTVTTGYTDCTAQDVEFTLATMISVAHLMDKSILKPIKTCFCHKSIEPLADYHNLFGDNVFFEQPYNSLWISYDVWSKSTHTANSALLDILKVQANQLLSELEKSGDFLEHVRFLIGTNLGSEEFGAEVLAEYLNMTSRTLHRRLEEQGTTFNKLRLEHMMIAARKALQDSEASVADIAQQLGYSESSPFVRVFKRIQGVSPLQFRKQKAH